MRAVCNAPVDVSLAKYRCRSNYFEPAVTTVGRHQPYTVGRCLPLLTINCTPRILTSERLQVDPGADDANGRLSKHCEAALFDVLKLPLAADSFWPRTAGQITRLTSYKQLTYFAYRFPRRPCVGSARKKEKTRPKAGPTFLKP